jgi:3-deoxy-D-manno-octulosonic-acid transferase
MPAPLHYRFKLRLLSPLFPLLLLRELKKRGGDRRFLKQRLGFGYAARKDRPVWLHAASVGELNTALPLLKRLHDDYPRVSFVVTTNTPTAARLFEKQQLARCAHCYLPIDLPECVGGFIRAVKPRLGLILETELWPNLYARCARAGIPLLLLNARLSRKSFDAPGWVRDGQRYCVAQLDHILARSEADREQFLALDASPERTTTVDNLKYAPSPALAATQTVTHRPYVLAASTHEDEEFQFARLLGNMLRHYGHLLVIAPRHPERRADILRQLSQLPLRIALRSRNDAITAETDVYLLDSMGELQGWIAGAELVLIGGSWIPHGGQNLLEPARAGKPVIAGPFMHNFAQETADLVARNAALQLHSAPELISETEKLLQHPESAAAMGRNARGFMQDKSDVVDRYMQTLQQIRAFKKAFQQEGI